MSSSCRLILGSPAAPVSSTSWLSSFLNTYVLNISLNTLNYSLIIRTESKSRSLVFPSNYSIAFSFNSALFSAVNCSKLAVALLTTVSCITNSCLSSFNSFSRILTYKLLSCWILTVSLFSILAILEANLRVEHVSSICAASGYRLANMIVYELPPIESLSIFVSLDCRYGM